MKQKFENDSYSGADRIAMLENKAAELERQLRAATPPGGFARWPNAAVPSQAFEDPDFEDPDFEDASYEEPDFEEPEFEEPDFEAAGEREGTGVVKDERDWAKAARPA